MRWLSRWWWGARKFRECVGYRSGIVIAYTSMFLGRKPIGAFLDYERTNAVLLQLLYTMIYGFLNGLLSSANISNRAPSLNVLMSSLHAIDVVVSRSRR
jgi:hypothetical protein